MVWTWRKRRTLWRSSTVVLRLRSRFLVLLNRRSWQLLVRMVINLGLSWCVLLHELLLIEWACLTLRSRHHWLILIRLRLSLILVLHRGYRHYLMRRWYTHLLMLRMHWKVWAHPILSHSFILILLPHHWVCLLMMRLGSHLHGWAIEDLRTHAACIWLILCNILILLNQAPSIDLSSINAIIRIRSLRMRPYLLEIRFYLLILLRYIPISLSHHDRMTSWLLLIYSYIHPHLGRMILYWRLLSRILTLKRRDRYELCSIQIKVLILLLLLWLTIIHKSCLCINRPRRMRYVGWSRCLNLFIPSFLS